MDCLKLGKFFGNCKPQFKGAIDGTVCQADAGDSPLNCGLQTVAIFRRGSRFECQKRRTQTAGQRWRCQSSGERREILSILRIRWRDNVGGFAILAKSIKEFAEAPAADLLED